MIRRITTALVIAVICLLPRAAAQERDRAAIPDKYKWNLSDLYASDEAWRAAKEKLAPQLATIAAFKGTLASSATRLADALDAVNAISRELQKVFVYASLSSDQDTRVSKYQGMQQEMQQIAANFGEQVSFIEPEILKIDKARLDAWVAQEPRLKTYQHYLDDIQRRRPHTLSDAEERLLAASSVPTSASSSLYNIFFNAHFPYPPVSLSRGKSVKLDSSAFSLYRGVANREDRKQVMDAFFNALGKYKGTFGATLNGQVQTNEFYANARHYEAALDSALDGPNVPPSVYKQLVDGVNQGLPTFHRYLQLRKKILNLPDLAYYDLYAPLVASADLNYTPNVAVEREVTAAISNSFGFGGHNVALALKRYSE